MVTRTHGVGNLDLKREQLNSPHSVKAQAPKMRNEIVRAALEALGRECRISAEELSSRLSRMLDEYQSWARLQDAIEPPYAVRDHWRDIDRQLQALLMTLTNEAKVRLTWGGAFWLLRRLTTFLSNAREWSGRTLITS
jgi:hypothetical protein